MAFEISDESGSSFEKSGDFSPVSHRSPAPAARRAPAASAYDFDIEDDDEPSPPARRPAAAPAQARAAPGSAALQAASKERAAALLAAASRQQQTFKDSAARAASAAAFAFEDGSSESSGSFDESDISLPSPGPRAPAHGGRAGSSEPLRAVASASQGRAAAAPASRLAAIPVESPTRAAYAFELEEESGSAGGSVYEGSYDEEEGAALGLSADSGSSARSWQGAGVAAAATARPGVGVRSPPAAGGGRVFSPARVVMPPSPGLRVGDAVLSRYGGAEEAYEGLIIADNGDGSYGVRYDMDGDEEEAVPRSRITRRGPPPGGHGTGGGSSLGSPSPPPRPRLMQFSDISALAAAELASQGGRGGDLPPSTGLDAHTPSRARYEYVPEEEEEGEGLDAYPSGDFLPEEEAMGDAPSTPAVTAAPALSPSRSRDRAGLPYASPRSFRGGPPSPGGRFTAPASPGVADESGYSNEGFEEPSPRPSPLKRSGAGGAEGRPPAAAAGGSPVAGARQAAGVPPPPQEAGPWPGAYPPTPPPYGYYYGPPPGGVGLWGAYGGHPPPAAPMPAMPVPASAGMGTASLAALLATMRAGGGGEGGRARRVVAAPTLPGGAAAPSPSTLYLTAMATSLAALPAAGDAAAAEAAGGAAGGSHDLPALARSAGLHPAVVTALARYQAGLAVADTVFARQLGAIRVDAARAKARVDALSAPPGGGSPGGAKYAPRLAELQRAFAAERARRPGLSYATALHAVQAGLA